MDEDLKDFKEWEYLTYGVIGLIDGYAVAKRAWLEGRRTLREKWNKSVKKIEFPPINTTGGQESGPF